MGTTPDNSECKSVHVQGIHIIYYNGRSLLSKIDELRLVSEATKPDIISLVETWLDNDVLNNEIFLSNYQLLRLDRNRHGGGIALYLRNVFSCNVLLQGGPNNLEFLSVSIVHTSFVNRLCVCLFYRPPSSPVSIFNDLCTTLHIVNPAQFSNFLLIGYFM